MIRSRSRFLKALPALRDCRVLPESAALRDCRELKALQKDNQRLRKIIADQRIDMEILKEAIEISAKNL